VVLLLTFNVGHQSVLMK